MKTTVNASHPVFTLRRAHLCVVLAFEDYSASRMLSTLLDNGKGESHSGWESQMWTRSVILTEVFFFKGSCCCGVEQNRIHMAMADNYIVCILIISFFLPLFR